MRRLARLILVLAAACGPAVARAADGDLLARERYTPAIGYAEWFGRIYAGGTPRLSDRDPPLDPAKGAAYFNPALYRELFEQRQVGIERIAYESDRLRIDGFLVQPKAQGRYPVILWLRGGNREIGVIKTRELMIMTAWARRGYVIVASNYRGSPKNEGKDEFGGADVHDVLALLPLVRGLAAADASRLFLYGESRGGMMAYRALHDGLAARAVAVNGGLSNLDAGDRPDMMDVYAELVPDYARQKADHFCSRSAICWPEKISAPTLMLAAAADWRVSSAQPLALATRLQALRKPYALSIVSGGMHVYLDEDQERIDDEVLSFFENYGAHSK